MPQRAFFSVIRARRITRRRPNPPILFLDQIFGAQAFLTTVTPIISNALVQTFGKCFCQTISYCLRHNGVVVVVLSPEPVAQLLQSDSAGHSKTTNMIGQPRLFGSDEVGKGSAWLAAFFVRLLAEKMKSIENTFARFV